VRIVSLLPSATDIVFALGLQDQLVGRTHECDWPPGIETVPAMTRDELATQVMSSREIHDAVGGSVHSGSSIYGLDTEALRDAAPDLILTQELCEVCAVSYTEVCQAARLLESDAKIVSLEPHTIDDILEHVRLVGELTGASDRAADVVADARARLQKLRDTASGAERPRVVCIEWLDPIFASGHWVPEQVEVAGGREMLGLAGEHSTQTTWDAVTNAAPQVLVLLPCGMPIERTLAELDAVTTRPGWDDLPAVHDGRVWVVDASSYYNRPGPRIVRGAEILHEIFHRDGEGLRPDEAVRVPNL
jgi:iron complex transport system substrate-binding protein